MALLLCGEPALAEDAVSDAFVAVYRPWREGRVVDFGPYLRTAVIRNIHGVFRRRLRERREERRWRVEPHPGAAFEADTAESDVLGRALAQLPTRQRAAVVLRYYEDLSEADTARLMGTSVGTVKAHASRGLARLRPLLERAESCDE
ncbi:MAG: sigma-70 family RNA polymerase sigma factor [Actinomycetota bacterium]|nr:sigma-70 family RNA polymerase sigma factor [Actinomycetota bacterium]MDQ6945883.1 sigma-70 family RNA polymerase sigma factor [Actinomycetota bacterium]